MLHLFNQVRQPIDGFEQSVINAYSTFPFIDAIWIREVPTVAVPTPAGPKNMVRMVWLQLARQPKAGTIASLANVGKELEVRSLAEPFWYEAHWIVDELPPAAVAPSCIYRRGPASR